MVRWDTRAGPEPVSVVGVAECHTQPVYSTVWVASKTASELMTSSADGTIRVRRGWLVSELIISIVQWWDTRNFTEATETVILDPENMDPESPGEVDRAFTPSILEYDPTIPARYMVRHLSYNLEDF